MKSGKLHYLLFGAPVVMLIISMFIGRYPLSPQEVFATILVGNTGSTADIVIFRLRLPRALAVMLVGASLAAAGACFQGIFKNPLVSSHILGVVPGAGFGACIAILLGWASFYLQLSAFLFGCLAVGITYGISRVYKGASTLLLVLAGIVVGAFFTSLISVLKYVADPYDKLPAIVFWLMGSFSAVRWNEVVLVAVPILTGLTILTLMRWRINVLALGEEEAESLGVNTKRDSAIVILCATVITAASVSISGVIGWVGLIIPHIARFFVGPNYKILLPVSIAIGATYLLVIDDIARCAIAAEIPIGILTGLIGAPFFLLILIKIRGMGWS